MTTATKNRLAEFCALPRAEQEGYLKADPVFGPLFADAVTAYRAGKVTLGRSGYGVSSDNDDTTFEPHRGGPACLVGAAMLGRKAAQRNTGAGQAASTHYGVEYWAAALMMDGFDAGRAVMGEKTTSVERAFGAAAFIFAEREFGPAVNLLEAV